MNFVRGVSTKTSEFWNSSATIISSFFVSPSHKKEAEIEEGGEWIVFSQNRISLGDWKQSE